MATGTPVIAFRRGAAVEVIRQGETGFLVPHGDVPALARRMLELAGAPTLVARLGRGARAFAAAFSWDRAAQATEAHLAGVIAQGG